MPTMKGDMNPATARLAELYTLGTDNSSDVRFHSYSPGDVNGSYFEQTPQGHFRYTAVWQLVEKTKMQALRGVRRDSKFSSIEMCLDLAFSTNPVGDTPNMKYKIAQNEGDDLDRILCVKHWFEAAQTAIFARETCPMNSVTYWDMESSFYLSLGTMWVLIGCSHKAAVCFRCAATAMHMADEVVLESEKAEQTL